MTDSNRYMLFYPHEQSGWMHLCLHLVFALVLYTRVLPCSSESGHYKSAALRVSFK